MAKQKKDERERSALEYVTDPLIALAQGGVAAGDSLVGLANLAGGLPVRGINKGLELASRVLPFEAHGYDPEVARQFLNSFKSEAQKRADAQVAAARQRGLKEQAKAAMNNPSTIGNTMLELAPTVASASGLGKKVGEKAIRKAAGIGGKAPGWWRETQAAATGALGEGLMGAGNAAAQMQQAAPGTSYSGSDYLNAAGQGALSGLTGLAGGMAVRGVSALPGVNRLGIRDVDSALTARAAAAEDAARAQARGSFTATRPGAFTPEVGTGANRAVLASTTGEMALENPAQQTYGDRAGAAAVQAANAVVGYMPWKRRKKEEKPQELAGTM